MNRGNNTALTARIALLICAAVGIWGIPRVDAQDVKLSMATQAWEYSPYRVLVWVVDDGLEAVDRIWPQIEARVVRDSRLDEYNAWQVTCERPESIWRHRLNTELAQIREVHTNELGELLSARGSDKLIVLRLTVRAGACTIEARELDLMTRHWGEMVTRSASQFDLVPGICYQSVRDAFKPLARVERVAESTVYTRMRAVNLSRQLAQDEVGNPIEVPLETSPVWPQNSDLMLPVVRRNDRDDNFSSVEIAPLTFLTIESREESVLKCHMFTGEWAPLSGRTGSRTQKFALVIRPRGETTQLTVISKNPKNPAPLAGIEIYSRRPGEDHTNDLFIGKTDWRGRIEILPADDKSVRLIYVKNGKRELKMVPVMPGLFDEITAAVIDDKARVFAASVAQGWKNRILDFVARREIIKTRIKQALMNKEFAKARQIYDIYQDLPKASQLQFQLIQSKEQLLARKDTDTLQRNLIVNMFDALDGIVMTRVRDEDSSDLFQRIINEDSSDPDLDPEDVVPDETPASEESVETADTTSQ